MESIWKQKYQAIKNFSSYKNLRIEEIMIKKCRLQENALKLVVLFLL